MSTDAFHTIISTLQIGFLLAIVLAVVSFVCTVFGWKGPHRKRHILRTLIAVVAIPGIAVLLSSLVNREYIARMETQRSNRYAETSVVRIGDLAPDLTLTDADGAEFSMGDSKGKVVLINFFATWCGPCKKELPHIENIWDKYHDYDSFSLMVIGRDESMEKVRDFRSENGFTFPIAPDPEGHVYSLFATKTIPRTIVVAPDGTIVYAKAEFYERDVDVLRSVLREQLANLE